VPVPLGKGKRWAKDHVPSLGFFMQKIRQNILTWDPVSKISDARNSTVKKVRDLDARFK
jgi:hypothetical protein